MSERAQLVEWIRGELVGPSRALVDPAIAEFTDRVFVDREPLRRGPLAWRPAPGGQLQEVLYYDRESPHRKYGIGLLHPASPPEKPDAVAGKATDSLGIDPEKSGKPDDLAAAGSPGDDDEDNGKGEDRSTTADERESTDDFEVTSNDVRRPSTVGISFCAHLPTTSTLLIRLPQSRSFAWQDHGAPAFMLNGRYESCRRRINDSSEDARDEAAWRRVPAVLTDAHVQIRATELKSGQAIRRELPMPEGSPIRLEISLFPRALKGRDSDWLITVVLRNISPPASKAESKESIFYQAHFEVDVKEGSIEKYPESCRPFSQLDLEEQSLALLYRESASWGIGHGCAAGWDAGPGEAPHLIYTDLMPAVQLPSMTPDISDTDGNAIQLSMRELASLRDDGTGPAWDSLDRLVGEYSRWIGRMEGESARLPPHLAEVAKRHLAGCRKCLERIDEGLALLRRDDKVRQAFRLANLSMLLQQVATKQLSRRPLGIVAGTELAVPTGDSQSPWEIYRTKKEDTKRIGSWRAFQIAFLLMSLRGSADGESPDRDIVDLIWFPTGGGKTEAYLAVMAFYMLHQRLLMMGEASGIRRDGTNVLMRYTLRMLTTQQFQRAASLICAMEFLRRNAKELGVGALQGRRFSLGLWIGSDGSPNNVESAKVQLGAFRRGDASGNPLVLTECPWCRAEIGRYEGDPPKKASKKWNEQRIRGISLVEREGPLLHCTDGRCAFGGERWEGWLPVEVIDERIYSRPPSLVIATADKFAMVAFRPRAGALFGRVRNNGKVLQDCHPPGLIVQDELHLISGPLGTVYGLYEAVFERLCSFSRGSRLVRPKIIASTATIRGAADQVRALYGRTQTQLFPNPGLDMGDSFFGLYARRDKGKGPLSDGRLYLGIHAADYGSVLTTQVRTFSSALFRPASMPADRRDAWWSLLCFYNSIRELGGAKTLFDSDIRSRLKFMFNRENVAPEGRRNLKIVEELTGRLSQAGIVGMMDLLSTEYSAADDRKALDACLVSNIIEVGVDIDRLSLMGVVGQPKTTSTYIQVTGRVGRRWWERPGLVLMVYNPSKCRDRSHFEQFHSYHRRLYERVEPTSATPFALSAIQRALPGAMLVWARQQADDPVYNPASYASAVESAYNLLRERCKVVQYDPDQARSLQEMERVRLELEAKWGMNPQDWEEFPPNPDGEYLMLWPGQFATPIQKKRGVVVPSSMRQVDGSAELVITPGYSDPADVPQATPAPTVEPPRSAGGVN